VKEPDIDYFGGSIIPGLRNLLSSYAILEFGGYRGFERWPKTLLFQMLRPAKILISFDYLAEV